jgi:hypothetical protein
MKDQSSALGLTLNFHLNLNPFRAPLAGEVTRELDTGVAEA